MPNFPEDYTEMVEREQQFYKGDRPADSIPSIFTYWACKFLTPRMIEMFGTNSIEEFYALEIKRIIGTNKSVNILSLGSGEASSEILILKHLHNHGIEACMTCTDISPLMSNAGKTNAEDAGLSKYMEFRTLDINRQFPEVGATFVIANHSLHHFVELEFIFENIQRQIEANGAFIVSDMIGRNGHMRWPEVLGFTKAFWNLLPSEKRIDRTHGIHRPEFIDWDCANGTFEGIRAQDILPLCVEMFSFDRFLGFGGVQDTFIDRMYGANFSSVDPADLAFIDTIEALNTSLLISGEVKPTTMLATLRPRSFCIEDGRYWPSSPRDAVRHPA